MWLLSENRLRSGMKASYQQISVNRSKKAVEFNGLLNQNANQTSTTINYCL